MNGLLISFEGSEGCGKTTQIAMLAARLKEKGFQTLHTREPGGTPLGEQIRELVKFAAAGHGMCPEAELLLFCASRAQLVRDVISPALAEGKIVLADRFHDSSTAYQGLARGLNPSHVADLHDFTIAEVRPHLTFVLDMPVEIGRRRAMLRPKPVNAPEDRMESEPPEFYEKVRQGYLDLAAVEPDRIRVIDAEKPRDDVADLIWTEVSRVLRT